MNRKITKRACGLLTAFLMAAVMPFQVIESYAATARISFSDPGTKVGETFTVTMKFACTSGEMLGDTKVMLDYDAGVLEFINETDNASGGAGKISVRSGLEGKTVVETQLKFKALQAGTTTIAISDWDGYDNNGGALNMEREGSSTITIEGLPTSSADASLQLLQISPGTLEPSFSPDVEAYTTTVGLSVERLTVSARANNDNAAVAVDGAAELAAGENTVICRVTAEDGTTVKDYTITVNKTEGGAGDAGDDGENQENGESGQTELEVLSELRASAKVIRIVALPEGVTVPQGFKESSISVGDTKVQGWTLETEDNPSFCLFYAMNEEGEPDFYCYDITEKTIQRYFVDAGKEELLAEKKQLAQNYNSLVDDYQKARYIGFGLMGLAGILIIAVIVLLVTRKNSGGYGHESTARVLPEPGVRNSRAKKPTREERYMMGEEEPVLSSVIEEIPDRDDTPATDEVEQVIADNLAKEAAAALEAEDDFEFFDLDDKQ